MLIEKWLEQYINKYTIEHMRKRELKIQNNMSEIAGHAFFWGLRFKNFFGEHTLPVLIPSPLWLEYVK